MLVKVLWKEGVSFEGVAPSGHRVVMDGSPLVGGRELGPRPSELVLSAVGGCTGIDAVSILEKMRVELDRFEIDVEGTTAADHPKSFTDVRLTYRFWGEGISPEAVTRAVSLSVEKYCMVLHSLKARATWVVELNGQEITPRP